MNLREVIKTLEIAKAEVEWDYPMDYAVGVGESRFLELMRKPKRH